MISKKSSTLELSENKRLALRSVILFNVADKKYHLHFDLGSNYRNFSVVNSNIPSNEYGVLTYSVDLFYTQILQDTVNIFDDWKSDLIIKVDKDCSTFFRPSKKFKKFTNPNASIDFTGNFHLEFMLNNFEIKPRRKNTIILFRFCLREGNRVMTGLEFLLKRKTNKEKDNSSRKEIHQLRIPIYQQVNFPPQQIDSNVLPPISESAQLNPILPPLSRAQAQQIMKTQEQILQSIDPSLTIKGIIDRNPINIERMREHFCCIIPEKKKKVQSVTQSTQTLKNQMQIPMQMRRMIPPQIPPQMPQHQLPIPLPHRPPQLPPQIPPQMPPQIPNQLDTLGLINNK